MKTYYKDVDAWVDMKAVPLPASIRGFTMMMEDGSYTVLINDQLSNKATDATCKHELEHIKNRDFNKEEEAHNIEAMHKYQHSLEA